MLIPFVVLYLLVTVAIGFWASRRVKNTQDFVVAGRRLPLFMAASVMFATWFGSETILGASSEFVNHGLIGVIEDPFGAALCLFLVGLIYARPLYRMNILTFCDYFRIRYHKSVEVISAAFIVPTYIAWIAAQLLAMAIVLEAISGLDMTTGVLISSGLVMLYTFTGGMWSVSITDFMQTILIIVGMVILTVIMVNRAGGVVTVIEAAPSGFFEFFPERSWDGWVHYVVAWITIGLGAIPQQDIFQRVMAARSERVAVRASYLSAGMYLSIGMLPLLIALCARQLYPDLALEVEGQGILPQMVLQHTGLALQILFFGALLSAIMSTSSGAMLAPASVIGENLVRHLYPKLTDKQLLRIIRFSVLGVGLASIGLALQGGKIYDLVGYAATFSLVSLFVPLTAGLFWKRANTLGALVSAVLGMAVWLVAEILGTETPSIVWGFGASVLGMAASFLRPATPSAVPDRL